ncbi:AAA family ATPase [Actinotalea ferrariae]|uniref:AAA family ATPase n=1 Tax=Actinotalea ferrariae TaxID=1386098 RepID=UPI001C8BEBCA|nr:AAA family ATPase [Actinotalea ferrariae]MBX9244916.1 AAA family ATPase [Actinotalea ferrariae]
MIRTVAIENYRSLQRVVTGLDRLTVVTGANGSGKTSFYRALRLLADLAREGAISTLAQEGGMRSALHAGQRDGGRISMRLGFASDELSYAIDLGLPQPGVNPFALDPEIKVEAVWTGPLLRPGTLVADRLGPRVRTRNDDGAWRTADWRLGAHESLMSALADPSETPELYAVRQQATGWRFYDHFRTDDDAGARRPGIATYTPVLAPGGEDLAAALLTIQRVGVAPVLEATVADAFDGARLELVEEHDGVCRLALHQPGLLRPLGARELSDGTLRYLLLAAALLSPRPPGLLVLNEPEASLHPSLMPALAALVVDAAQRSQVVLVTHSGELVRCLRGEARLLELERSGGATTVAGQLALEGPAWSWPKR